MPQPVHLLIPFAACDAAAARDALRHLALPHLDTLLRRLVAAPSEPVPADAPEMPHERAQARALGLDTGPGLTPWAALDLRARGRAPGTDAWAWVTPCHWQVGMDHVRMHHPAALRLDDADAHALRAAMAPFFASDGIALTDDTPGRWLACGEAFRGLVTASLDRVAGHDVRPWLTPSPQARPLRRLQSEMQMLLHAHPVNEARARHGLVPVNALWFSGAGALGSDTDRPPGAAPPPQVEPALREPALCQDWAAWARAWQALDAGALADLLARHRRGVPVRLTLCGEQASQTFGPGRPGWRQRISSVFGRIPASDRLFLL